MVGSMFGGGSHYNPDEPRDWHGRWTSGGDSGSAPKVKPSHFGHGKNPPLHDLSAAGRATSLLVHTGVQLKWAHGFPDVTHKMGERFAPVLAAWNADSRLGHRAFYDRYVGFDAGYHAVDDLRQAAALAACATTFNDMADAAEPFAAAVRTIASRCIHWPAAMKRLKERANEAIDQGKVVLAAAHSPIPVAQSLDPTQLKKENFVTEHLADAQAVADRLHVPVEFILGISAVESTWGASRFANVARNFFGMMHKHGDPGDFVHALDNPTREMWRYSNYAESANAFAARYGKLIVGVNDPSKFAKILQDTGNYGIDPKTDKPMPGYVKEVAATIRGLAPVIARIKERGGI